MSGFCARRRLMQVMSFVSLYAAGSTSSYGALLELTRNQHGASNVAAANISGGAFQMSLLAGPSGALLNESHSAGLGIDSSPVVGPVNEPVGDRNRFNLVRGGPLAGVGESATFSFNRAGMIEGLLFDGIKDETLEYFRLELPSGEVRTFVDFEVATRLQEQGFTLAALALPGLQLLADANDDLLSLAIGFQAGDVFKLTYGEFPYPQGYLPRSGEVPNGGRWEGIIVTPEPASGILASIAVSMLRLRVARRRPSR